MFKLSTSSIQNRSEVNKSLIDISDLAIKITLVDFGHGPDSGLRSAERQNQLYREKKSNADGYTNQSSHQSGMALDFYAFVNGKASWEKEHLAVVACAFLQAASILGHRVKWGGLWKSSTGGIYGWDMPHVQIIKD